MSDRLTPDAARQLIADKLGTSPRAAHSLFVGELMAGLAHRFEADAELWRLVGWCHDLDYYAVDGDWSRHGLLASDWLDQRLPDEARAAIRAHDHRTGVVAHSLIADMLKLADALAVFDEQAGRAATAMLRTLTAREAVQETLSDKPWVGALIDDISGRHGLGLDEIAELVSALPQQRSDDG